jgi:seryl-tRNA synthetase
MLDIKFIRENKEVIREGARKKHIDFNVESLIVVDAQRRELVTSMESKKSDQNKVSQEIQSTQKATA